MLITNLKGNTKPFEAYKDLMIEQEINKLDILTFVIPEQFISQLKNEYLVTTEKQIYVVKNIEPHYNDYKIECKQDISDWYSFNQSLNFPYKQIKTVILGIMPNGWQAVYEDDIKEYRTITADCKMSIEVIEEVKKKYGVEVRFDNKNKKIYIAYKLAKDKGAYFSSDLNIIKKSIKTESFEFATRIIPEGMNGLMINQINDGKNYLENKAYSDKTITYYWKDERFTNIKSLRDEAQEKLDELSKPLKSIEIKVEDLSKATSIYNLDFALGDYVHLLDEKNKTNEVYRIVKLKRYKNKPLATEITLNNKLIDLNDDADKLVNLTNEMWEKTRVRFETTENSIKGFVETQQKYTDDSFKTYKSEREMTDRRIYEAISESTTYVDPKTGQTKPIIDKQLEIDKSLDGIKIDIINQEKSHKDLIDINFDKIKEHMDSRFGELDTSISNVKGDVVAYKQAFDIAEGKVNSEIISLREEIDQSGNDIKKYISENYSSREQTDTAIQDKVGSVKNYVDTNFSTRTQTDQMIKSEVSSVKSDAQDAKEKAEKAYSEVLQTEREVSSKVGVNDVYSIIQQLPESVKIDAKNIDLSGNVDITGTFQTSSYGKRVKIEGGAIKFYDYSSLIGSMTVDSDGQINIQGHYLEDGYIRLNSNSGGNVYRNFSSDNPQSWLGGKSWGATALELTGLYSSVVFVDREFKAYERATFYGKPLFKDEINLDDKATINVTRSGGQVWISQTSSALSFVIDFDSKKTFFS